MGSSTVGKRTQGIMSKVYVVSVIEFAVLGLLLFGAAGTLDWKAAWVWLAILLAFTVPTVLMLSRHDPALLEERLKSPIQKGQKGWDKVLLTFLLGLWVLWLPLMGLDAVRFRWSEMPLSLQALGAAVLIWSIWVMYLCFRENTYLAPVVRIQKERGHHVISSGPYALVRHPMYAAALFYFPGTALLLGSWYGLAACLVLDGLLVLRTALEDCTLHSELPGYSDYAANVRYRLIPHVW